MRTAALSLPIVSRAPAGSGGSLAPSALKCKEEQGSLLAGGQGGPEGAPGVLGLSQAALSFPLCGSGAFESGPGFHVVSSGGASGAFDWGAWD